jgi:hypothetical protein
MGNDNKPYTVTCTLAKAVPDAKHVDTIRDAVLRVHRCTFYATELLNLYVRDRLQNHNGTGLDAVFTQNWLINAYQAVSTVASKKAAKIDERVLAVFKQHMQGAQGPSFDMPNRAGLTQALTYECINLAAVGSTNVWMHFQKRVLSYVRSCHSMDEEAYKQLSKQERTGKKLALLKVASDLCRDPALPLTSPDEYHDFVLEHRSLLGMQEAVSNWDGKPILYHLKASPHKFLRIMYRMSTRQLEAGRKAFALFPLRRSHVPGHMRFDKRVLDDLLKLGCAASTANAKKQKNLHLNADEPSEAGPSCSSGPLGRAPKRKRGDPSLLNEKAEVFNQVLDLRAAKVHRRHHFAFAFTTDGVSIHLNMEVPGKPEKAEKASKASKSTKRSSQLNTVKVMPKRGIHSIDTLKAIARKEDVHVIGIDPGKRELLNCVDSDDPRNKSCVRYTMRQRQRHMRTRQYADEMRRSKPYPVSCAEEDLSLFNSKSPHLEEFAAFASKRRSLIRDIPCIREFYDHLDHRNRRRKTRIKTQQSEADAINRISKMHTGADDKRTLVLAYGAWGLVAGRPNMVGNKGNPPVIGVGLMKKLALHFVVSPTPEHFTSKTCVGCGGLCGPHPTLKTKLNKEIRGLRVCQHEGCGLLQNRDKTGATNIGRQFLRLLEGEGPIRPMTDTELEFHRLSTCLECCESD